MLTYFIPFNTRMAIVLLMEVSETRETGTIYCHLKGSELLEMGHLTTFTEKMLHDPILDR